MESSHTKELALIRIRLIADFTSTAQCTKDEFGIVIDLISEIAEMALSDDHKERISPDLWPEDGLDG